MRDESVVEQFERMEKGLKEEMVKYKRPLMAEQEDDNMKDKSLP